MVAMAVYSVSMVLLERNHISSLQSHGKALEKEHFLPGVFHNSGNTPANLLCELIDAMYQLFLLLLLLLLFLSPLAQSRYVCWSYC